METRERRKFWFEVIMRYQNEFIRKHLGQGFACILIDSPVFVTVLLSLIWGSLHLDKLRHSRSQHSQSSTIIGEVDSLTKVRWFLVRQRVCTIWSLDGTYVLLEEGVHN